MTRERIEDIAFAPMSPDLRNDLISGTHGDLAQAMADLLGTENATWTAMAQWTSRSLPSQGGSLGSGAGRLMANAVSEASCGIFAELGWAHVAFLATVGRAHRDGTDLDRAWLRWLDQLDVEPADQSGRPPGGTENELWASIRDPQPDIGIAGRNQLLVLGFRAYRDAVAEPDADRRARNILLGNCLLTLYEHCQLSTAISFGLRGRLRSLSSPWRFLVSGNARTSQCPTGRRLGLENDWIHYATRHLVSVRLPHRSILVGRAVPAGCNPIPVIAREIPPVRHGRRPAITADNDELLSRLFWQLDVDGSPARCWNDLIDRVAYLAAILAYHQRDQGWFDVDGRVVRPEVRTESRGRVPRSNADATPKNTKHIRAALRMADLWPVNCPADGSAASQTDTAGSGRQLHSYLALQALWLTRERRSR